MPQEGRREREGGFKRHAKASSRISWQSYVTRAGAILHSSSAEFVVCVCVSVCAELCVISSGSDLFLFFTDLLFQRITIREERGDVSNERIKLIDQRDFYVYRSVMRL